MDDKVQFATTASSDYNTDYDTDSTTDDTMSSNSSDEHTENKIEQKMWEKRLRDIQCEFAFLKDLLHKDKIKELNVRVVEAKKEYGVALQKLHNQRVRRLQKKYEMNYTKHMHESRQRLKPQNLKRKGDLYVVRQL